MYERTPMRASEILKAADKARARGGNPTYIICGKPGPTGKTWLCNELQKAGHNAVEISEAIVQFVSYHDNENHMLNNGFDTVIIILNKPLNEMWKL